MSKSNDAMELRYEVDEDIKKKWRRVRNAERPSLGWIRTIRLALEMSACQFARRLNVSESGVRKIEKSEVNDTIQIATLRRAAEALNCRFVYALIPEEPLEECVKLQRAKIAYNDLSKMAEKSDISRDEFHALMAAYARKVKPNRLWGV